MKILILCLPGIGDALMATPMIKVLRSEMPEVQIDVACMFEGVRYVFKNNPYINNVFYLHIYKQNKIKGLKEVWSLRENKYDVSILSFPAYRREYHLVQRIIGAKKRISHRFKKGYFLEMNFLDTDLIFFDENEHHVPNNLNLLKALGIEWERKYKKKNFTYDLILDKEDTEFGKRYFKNLEWNANQIVGIHPGSINSPAGILRRWPAENFIELIKKMIREKGKKVVIFAGPEERGVGIKINDTVNDSKNCQLIQNVSFGQVLGILNQISLLITHDNGFAHLGNALKREEIVLYGPTNMNWTAPYNKSLCKLIRKADFEPWFRNDIRVTDPPKDAKSGMESITVEDVLKTLKY